MFFKKSLNKKSKIIYENSLKRLKISNFEKFVYIKTC